MKVKIEYKEKKSIISVDEKQSYRFFQFWKQIRYWL